LASHNKPSGDAVYSMPNANLVIEIELDTSELQSDLEKIERGELSLPTVSAVTAFVNQTYLEDILIYLEHM
jgi:hypothetical protein